MKKLLLILILSVLALTGCTVSKANTDEPAAKIDSKEPSAQTPSSSQGIWFNKFTFEKVELEKAPKNVSDLYEQNKKDQKVVVVDDGDFTYVVAMMGEKATGGYEIKVTSIADAEQGKLAVTVEMMEPAKDAMVAQVISYPVDIVKIKKTDLPIYSVDTNGNSITTERK